MEGWCRSFQEGLEPPTGRAVETIRRCLDLLRSLVFGQEGIESAAEQSRVEAAIAILEKGPGAQERMEAEVPGIPVAAVSGPGGIDSVRIRYSLIEELLGLSREIMLLEKSAPPLPVGLCGGGLKAWMEEYRALVKGLYLRLAELRLMSVGDFVDLFGKAVRDLARQNGKKVRLEVRGEAIAADITLLERLREPILHLLRNAIAHGIEPPEARRAVGKDPEGRIVLEAKREKGSLYLALTDDGRGIDRDAIRDYLRRKMLMSEDALYGMQERKLLETIVHPEFSSAQGTTDMAGRGIGMTVVARTLEGLGGRLQIQSEPGKGTTFVMKLPVSLSVMKGLVLRVGPYSLSIPTLDVRSVSRTDGNREGETSDLIDLRRFMGVSDDGHPAEHLVRVRSRDWGADLAAAERETGLLVDRVIGNRSMMVLPLGDLLAKAKIYSGAGILENGDLTILVDVEGLVEARGGIRQRP
jgi:two-component system chemotaxis sensor kinase CheA